MIFKFCTCFYFLFHNHLGGFDPELFGDIICSVIYLDVLDVERFRPLFISHNPGARAIISSCVGSGVAIISDSFPHLERCAWFSTGRGIIPNFTGPYSEGQIAYIIQGVQQGALDSINAGLERIQRFSTNLQSIIDNDNLSSSRKGFHYQIMINELNLYMNQGIDTCLELLRNAGPRRDVGRYEIYVYVEQYLGSHNLFNQASALLERLYELRHNAMGFEGPVASPNGVR